MHYVTIDGMMSGTGVRSSTGGGYIRPSDLGLSEPLRKRIACWLSRYADAHVRQYENLNEIAELDAEGLAIACSVSDELPGSKVEYYSDGRMAKLEV